MVGLIIRALPFWVREPLLIAFGIPFSGFLFYAAVRDSEWLMAALGLAVLVFTGIRIYTVAQALKLRRLGKELGAAAE
jgi:hypothetical protein